MGFTTDFGLHSQATRLFGSTNLHSERRMSLAPSTGSGPPQWDIVCRKVKE